MAKQNRVKLQLYTPHSGQAYLHASEARFRVATCGRRWGKTFACVNELMKHGAILKDRVLWWVAPTYKQTDIAYRIMTSKFSSVISREYKADKMLKLPNKSLVMFRSADNYDSLRGEGVSFLVVDETASIDRAAWEECLRPTLSDHRGSAILVGTPKGRNFFYELFCRGADPLFPEWASFKFPTSSNPYISKDEIAEAKASLPSDVFRQEYEAEFLEDGSGVFRNIHGCIDGSFMEPKAGHSYVVGWDIAKYQDFSVFTVIDTVTNHVVYWARYNQLSYDFQLEVLADIVKKYNYATVWMDTTGVGDPVYERVVEKGIMVNRYTFSNTSKRKLIENLILCLERNTISYPDITEMVHELELFQFEVTAANNVRYEAPAGYHDDCVISLALAAWGASEPPMVRSVPRPKGY